MTILASMFELGKTIGYYSAGALTIVFCIIWIWVMFKYLDTSDLK